MVVFVLVFIFNIFLFWFVFRMTERITRYQIKRKFQQKEIHAILEKYDKLIEKMDQMQDQIVAFNKGVGKKYEI